MHNSMPTSADLPSSRQLLRSTIIALIAATVLLITVVLPAEYAIDPTGVGRVLGLTEMGEIKGQLAEEAAADAARDAALAAEQSAFATAPATVAVTSPAQPVEDATWRDEMRVVLQPGQGAEVKLSMKTGEQAQFSWVAEGGVVNFDTHGDGGGQSISYEKGRAVPADDGVLEAAFDGNHGWFWRNRDSADVTVIIRTRGQYTEMKRVL
ncbi:transmembrane anchor protein [Pseudomonas chengduensis]|uniref:transmembrane anchor protein n=1 Tax=Stutzerimonas stutzeri TaxID=316 RepID=UPI001A26ACD7|nr:MULTISPECIES: transmembrane anchor protein [Pseudomonadaceae]MBG7303419.1 transmembrane anchor protein [Pseudomonas aeruginosa]MDH0624145.1 transmembrane anchor protein [Pseudomonas chengduensis]MDH1213451.1 transmembrane anchor protein [Pseudomonas chengduensis]MDH1281741.1 transmembrane anchor protein [Pseudomonas chengduensis]MDH1667430.1 transmembrane anchor protein [Pseudomonas chengduensis]